MREREIACSNKHFRFLWRESVDFPKRVFSRPERKVPCEWYQLGYTGTMVHRVIAHSFTFVIPFVWVQTELILIVCRVEGPWKKVRYFHHWNTLLHMFDLLHVHCSCVSINKVATIYQASPRSSLMGLFSFTITPPFHLSWDTLSLSRRDRLIFWCR